MNGHKREPLLGKLGRKQIKIDMNERLLNPSVSSFIELEAIFKPQTVLTSPVIEGGSSANVRPPF